MTIARETGGPPVDLLATSQNKVTIPTRYNFSIILSGQALWLVSTCGQCWYNNDGKCPVHGRVRKLWDERQACWKFEAAEEQAEVV